MDFTITDEQQALREAVRGTLSRRPSSTDSKLGAGPVPFDADTWSALVETGVPGLLWPEADGGLGAGMAELAVAAQELGAVAAQTPLADIVLAGVLVQELGTDEQRASLLGGIADGSVVLLPALEEPGRRWSFGVASSVTADGDRLTGTKAPVRFAEAATHVVVSAKSGGKNRLFLVEKPTAQGDSITLDGAAGIPLGDDPTAALARAHNAAIAVLCAESLGAMEAALTITVAYLKTRKQFGVTLATFQALTHRAADMYTSLELARSATYFAAMTADEDRDDSDTISRAKAVVGKAGRHIGQEAIQLHGGIGMTAELLVGHLTARLTAIEHTYGDTRAHLGRLSRTLTDHQAVDVLV